MADNYITFPSTGGGGGGIPDDGSVTDIKVAVGANINAAKLGTGVVNNTEFNYLDGVTSAIQTQLDSKEVAANKGVAGGYASLDGSGKVPLSQINDAILGQVEYQGTWDPSTNTPTLVDPPASTTKGDYYVCSASGTRFSISFVTGDWIISNGSAWEKVDNTDAVATVFGRIGNILAVSGDYAANQITNTPSGSIAATDVQAAINELDSDVQLKANAASPTFTGTVRISSLGTGILHADASGNLSSALIDNVDVSASAAIAGTKINPAFGTQNISTTGTLTAGASSATSMAVTGTAGAGFVDLGPQSSAPAASAANTVRLYSSATGQLVWRGSGTNIVTFTAPAAAQTYTFPASTSTIAVLGLAQTFSALQTFSAGITASGTAATTVSSTGGIVVSATGGSGRLQLNAQASAPAGTASNASVYADASGNLAFKAGTTAGAIFSASANTAVRTYTLPDTTSTLAVLGLAQTFTAQQTVPSVVANGTAGAGFVELANQSTGVATPTTALRLYAGSTGNLVYRQTNGFDVAHATVGNTATRTYTWPDLNGTVALSGAGQNWSTTGTLAAGATAITGVATSNLYFQSTNSGLGFVVGNITLGSATPGIQMLANATDAYLGVYTASGTAKDVMICYNGGGATVGGIRTSTTTTSFLTSSDYRLKENIRPITRALERVSALNPCVYTWKKSGEDDEGFIAHELQDVVPKAAWGVKDEVDENGNPKYQAVDLAKIVPVLTAAIKELKAKVDALESQIAGV